MQLLNHSLTSMFPSPCSLLFGVLLLFLSVVFDFSHCVCYLFHLSFIFRCPWSGLVEFLEVIGYVFLCFILGQWGFHPLLLWCFSSLSCCLVSSILGIVVYVVSWCWWLVSWYCDRILFSLLLWTRHFHQSSSFSYFYVHRRSKVSVQNSQAGQHDESRHNFKVVYIHQLGHYASLLSVLLLNWF